MGEVVRRIKWVALAIGLTLAAGTLGFVLIEDYPPFDALYMSVITITTVGYSEILPLSRQGRIFNTFLVIFGVGVMFYAIGVMTQTIIELQLADFFGKRRVRRMIEKLHNHYVVCGFGRVGRAAAAELQRSGEPFLVVDKDPVLIDRAVKAGMLGLVADATSDETLREVGIERARGLIAALASDADNLFLILSARALNPGLRVAARVNDEQSESKMRLAGADAVFRPYEVTGYRLAQAVLRPYVFEFLDFTTSTVDMGMNIALEQVKVPPGSPFHGRSLRDLQLRRDLGVIVLAIRRANGSMEFNPPAEAIVESGDHLIVMGGLEHLRKLAEAMAEVQS